MSELIIDPGSGIEHRTPFLVSASDQLLDPMAAANVVGLVCRRGLQNEQSTLFSVMTAVQQPQPQPQPHTPQPHTQWKTALLEVVAEAATCVPSVAGDRLFLAMSVYRAAFESGVHDPKALTSLMWKMLAGIADVAYLDAKSSINNSSNRVTNRTLVIDAVADNVSEKLHGPDNVDRLHKRRRRHHHHQPYLDDARHACADGAVVSEDNGRRRPTSGPRWYHEELERHAAASRAAPEPTMAFVLDGALHRLLLWLTRWAASPRLAACAVALAKGLGRKARKLVEASSLPLSSSSSSLPPPSEYSNAKVVFARLLLFGTALLPLPESANRLNELLKWLLGAIECGGGLEAFAVPTLALVLARSSATAVPDDAFVCSMRQLLATAISRRQCANASPSPASAADGALQDAAAYCLLQRLGRPASLEHVRDLCAKRRDELPTLGDLFRDLFATGAATAHPALLLLLNVFVAPHLGCLQHAARLPSDARHDVRAIVAHLDARVWSDPRPAFARTCSLLEPVVFPEAVEGAPPRCIPDLRSLGELEFAALVRAVAPASTSALVQRGRRRTFVALTPPPAGARVASMGLLSSDLVGHVLSFMSFRRVCRVACVSALFRNAARAPALWEQLYWRRFGADTRIGRPLPDTPQAGQCRRCFHSIPLSLPPPPPLRPVKAAKVAKAASAAAHCGGREMQHDWARLFRDKALAARAVCVGNVGRSRSPYKMRACPYLGCAFVIRTKAQQDKHLRIHDQQE